VTWVKFCGCTAWSDAALAVEAGADAVGMIFAPSPRRIDPAGARDIAARLPERVEAVGVFVDPSEEELAAALALLPRMSVQFCGSESPELVARYGARAIKAIHVGEADETAALAAACARYPLARVLFDTKAAGMAGGTGRTFAWDRVAPIARTRDVVIAGGLDAANVASCVRSVRPYGVDVRGGIESDGRKDAAKMRAFREAVRGADAA
jgi:phosphoribosylanthranilate isomerase